MQHGVGHSRLPRRAGRVEAAAAGDDPGVPHAGRGLPPLLGARLRRLAALLVGGPERRASRARRVGTGGHAARSSSRRTSTACTSAPAAARSSICTAVSTVVVCLGCGDTREAVRRRCQAADGAPMDRAWHGARPARQAPDGDADIDDAGRRVVRGAALRALRRPAQAGRRLLRRERAAPRATSMRARRSRAPTRLLVAGSSLMVYSGFRFVRLAHEPACRSPSSIAAGPAATSSPSSRSRRTSAML